MSEENQQEESTEAERRRRSGEEPDLRTIMGGEPSRVPSHRVPESSEDDVPPPYDPPVRDAEGRPVDAVEPPVVDYSPQSEQEKLPPVWPGDEKQPWFRRERGLPPIPGSEERAHEQARLDPEEFPTALADIPARGRAWGVTVLLPNVIGLIPTIGLIFGVVFLVANLFLFRQGQDVGAVMFRLRVVRENGDVAGFFQMFVRNMAANISLLVLGAGYFAALSDPRRRTWHDRWLGTYVVQDSDEYKTRKRSSSDIAFNWFWIIVLMLIALVVFYWLSTPVPTEAVPTDTGSAT